MDKRNSESEFIIKGLSDDDNKNDININVNKGGTEGENAFNPHSKVLKTGYLKKRSKFLHLWKTRFCILTTKYLFAFEGIEADTDCTMALPTFKFISIRREDKANIVNNKPNVFILKTTEGDFYFQAENRNERNAWEGVIKAITNENTTRRIQEGNIGGLNID